jgi:hypothetical protein
MSTHEVIFASGGEGANGLGGNFDVLPSDEI